MELSYPKVKRRTNGDYFIEFTLGSKRFRLVNGNKIKLNLKPNTYPLRQRKSKAELLAKEVYRYLISNNYSFDDTAPKNIFESLLLILIFLFPDLTPCVSSEVLNTAIWQSSKIELKL